MKKISILFRHSPYGNAASREGLDLALLSASFEQEVSVIFIGEGLLNLLPNQQPQLSGVKDYIATFKAMPLYDIESVLVCEQSLAQLGIGINELSLDCESASAALISHHLTLSDEVLVF
ncbi:sulfurtransferase complex subunit TusC [Shewanella intestini]|uniref:Sulfurtransferase complex subunit TusC n=1 Tax=Shewanella intestini TaxID=2017544 RepID=A0ABS5I173_9GAMM|nr:MULTISPECIES: sulfurtransferase complex subunit TusC [Shewanella]MBR9727150.1 sulfurtransferase complex subunit TusC [Shewanella intestini]MRG35952.1 sulfurtransferase complex subunit TusC [Shewanella sp. XMDDZSB0408]